MADPIMAAVAVAGAGALIGAAGESAALSHQKKVARRNADIARANASEMAARIRTGGRRTQGALRAAIGASGLTVEGSALDVLADSATETELDALSAIYEGEIQALGFGDKAALAKHQAKMARIKGAVGVGSSLLSIGKKVPPGGGEGG